MAVSSDQLITSIKRLITMPSNQSLLRDSDILALADENMKHTVIPFIDSLDQEFFTTKTLIPLIEGQADYAIPPRAIGRKMRDLKIIWGSLGNKGNVVQIPIERDNYYELNGVPFGFHFYGDRIHCVPPPAASNAYSFELFWFLAPGAMVKTSAAGQITVIAGDDVTISSVPSTFATAPLFDFVHGQSGCSYKGIDAQIDSIGGNVLTFLPDQVPSTLAIGDWVSLAGQSPLLQIPDEAFPYLRTLTALECCYAISDYEGADRLRKMADQQAIDLAKLLEPRSEGEPQVIINEYGFRGRGRAGWFGGLGGF